MYYLCVTLCQLLRTTVYYSALLIALAGGREKWPATNGHPRLLSLLHLLLHRPPDCEGEGEGDQQTEAILLLLFKHQQRRR